MSEMLRRVFAVLLALTFAVGSAPYGMLASRTSQQASGTDLGTMATAGNQTPMSGKCHGCGSNEAGAAAACAAFCAGMVALPVTAAAFQPIGAQIVGYAAPQRASGRTEPPDPRPPRLSILS